MRTISLAWMMVLAACSSDEVTDIAITGTDGQPVVTWSGADAETLTFMNGDAEVIWNPAPEDPPANCLNELQGTDGIEWGVLPAGYASYELSGELPLDELEAPESLDDGEYSVAIGVCVDAGDTARSYMSRGASFTVEDGAIVDVVVAE